MVNICGDDKLSRWDTAAANECVPMAERSLVKERICLRQEVLR